MPEYLSIALGIVAVMVVVWLVLRFSGVIVKVLRPSGIEVLTRIAGLLLAAIAVQLIADSVGGVRRAVHWSRTEVVSYGRARIYGVRGSGGAPIVEQLGFEGMPERLLVCTPSKLGSYTDCPRRYRYSYVDRPPPPKGPPWAHNSLGASVHTALRNWYGLPPDRRVPSALPALLKGTWVREGYRDEAQERAAYRQSLGWLEAYVGSLDADVEPLGVERVVAVKTAVMAFNGRADRIDARRGPSS